MGCDFNRLVTRLTSPCFRNYRDRRCLTHNSNSTLPNGIQNILRSISSLVEQKHPFFVLMAPQQEWKNEQRK